MFACRSRLKWLNAPVKGTEYKRERWDLNISEPEPVLIKDMEPEKEDKDNEVGNTFVSNNEKGQIFSSLRERFPWLLARGNRNLCTDLFNVVQNFRRLMKLLIDFDIILCCTLYTVVL